MQNLLSRNGIRDVVRDAFYDVVYPHTKKPTHIYTRNRGQIWFFGVGVYGEYVHEFKKSLGTDKGLRKLLVEVAKEELGLILAEIRQDRKKIGFKQ